MFPYKKTGLFQKSGFKSKLPKKPENTPLSGTYLSFLDIKTTVSTWHETSTWMSGFRTHFRPFAGTALSRKSTFLHLLSVCGNWSTCLSTYNTAGWRDAIVSTCSPPLNRFMIKVSTQYAVHLVAYPGRSAIESFPLEPVSSWLQGPVFYRRRFSARILLLAPRHPSLKDSSCTWHLIPTLAPYLLRLYIGYESCLYESGAKSP